MMYRSTWNWPTKKLTKKSCSRSGGLDASPSYLKGERRRNFLLILLSFKFKKKAIRQHTRVVEEDCHWLQSIWTFRPLTCKATTSTFQISILSTFVCLGCNPYSRDCPKIFLETLHRGQKWLCQKMEQLRYGHAISETVRDSELGRRKSSWGVGREVRETQKNVSRQY